MTTIVKTGLREVTISTTTIASIVVSKISSEYVIETLSALSTLTNGTRVITYSSDGIYIINVDDVYYIDLCVEDIHDHIKLDVIDILSNPIDECDHTMARYDFITLLLLGLQFFGNTTYSLLEQSDLPTVIGTNLQIVQDAINRSNLYVELNNSNSQSTNRCY